MKWLLKYFNGTAFIHYFGGGGGSSQPTQQNVTQTNLPEYARPYFEDLMKRGQEASQVEYQPYTGQRTAGFTPLQEKAFEGIQNLGPSPLVGTGAAFSGMAGLGGLSAGQQYQQMATDPNAIRSFMSPYMQNVVDFQKSQAVQDYARQLPGQQAAATRAGAFGGSRQAIVEAEAQRNLQNQLAGIQAQGSQSAFDTARQAQQFGANLGLQGFGLAGQMGQQFGQLGQQAFGQQAAALQAQQQAGAAQQAQAQDVINKRYEDFMQQTLYPQSQLQFYSSLLRGVPVAPQQTMYQYQAPASPVNQLMSAGLGAYGIGKMFAKEGGEIKGYAGGGAVDGYAVGGAVKSPQAQYEMALRMPIERLQQILQGMPGPIEQGVALLVLNQKKQTQTAMEGEQAQAQLAQPSVKDQILGLGDMADMDIPDGGIVGEAEDEEALPAAAQGGAIRFQSRGEVPGRFASLSEEEFEKSQPSLIPKALRDLYGYRYAVDTSKSPRVAQLKAAKERGLSAAADDMSGFTTDPVTGLRIPVSDVVDRKYADQYSEVPSTGIAAVAAPKAKPKAKTARAVVPEVSPEEFAAEDRARNAGVATLQGATQPEMSEDDLIKSYAEKAAGYMKEPREAFRSAQKASEEEARKGLSALGEEAKGLAALRAAAELSKGGRRGFESIGAALGAAGETGMQYGKERRGAEKELRASQMDMAKAEMAFKQGDYELGARLMDKSEDRKLKVAEQAGLDAYRRTDKELRNRGYSETERHNKAMEALYGAKTSMLGGRDALRERQLDDVNKQKALLQASNETKTAGQIAMLKRLPEYKGMSDDQIRTALATKYYAMLSGNAGLGAVAPAAPGAGLDLSKWGQSQQVGR